MKKTGLVIALILLVFAGGCKNEQGGGEQPKYYDDYIEKYAYIEWDDPLRINDIVPYLGEWNVKAMYDTPQNPSIPLAYVENEEKTITMEPDVFESAFFSTKNPVYRREIYSHEQLKALGIDDDMVMWGFYEKTYVIIVSDEKMPLRQRLIILKDEGADYIPLYVTEGGHIFRLERKL